MIIEKYFFLPKIDFVLIMFNKQSRLLNDLILESFHLINKILSDSTEPAIGHYYESLKDILVDIQTFLKIHNMKNSKEYRAIKELEDYIGTKKEYLKHNGVIPYELKVKRKLQTIEELNLKIHQSITNYKKLIYDMYPKNIKEMKYKDFQEIILDYQKVLMKKKYISHTFEEGLHELRRDLRYILLIWKVQGNILFVETPSSDKYAPKKYFDKEIQLDNNLCNTIERIVTEIGKNKKRLEKQYLETHIPNDQAHELFEKYWNECKPIIMCLHFLYTKI